MSPSSFQQLQRGFLMPVALFIVVGLGALALAISTISSSSFSSAVQEGVSIQTIFAADSGAQYAINRLLFDVDDKSVGDANCTSINGSTLNFSVSGLNNCSVDISCSISTVSGNSPSFYNVQADAQCGAGDLVAQRSVAVKAVLD